MPAIKTFIFFIVLSLICSSCNQEHERIGSFKTEKRAPNVKAVDAPSQEIKTVADDPDIFITAIEDKYEVYPNEQIILSYDLYTRYDTRYEGFEKEGRFRGFWLEYQEAGSQEAEKSVAMETVQYKGRKYVKATVRKIALFPAASGRYTLDLGRVRASIVEASSKRADILLQAEPIEITTRDFPLDGKPYFFTGASSRRLTIEASVPNKPNGSGTIEFVLELKGEGNLWGLKLPAINFGPDFELVQTTSEAKTGWVNGSVEGSKRFIFSLMPNRTGEISIPSVSFSYFDPSKESYETISTQPVTVRVDSKTRVTPPISSFNDGRAGLIILLDVSGSMLAEDLQPGNRFAVAKEALKEFLQGNEKFRIGIKVFAREVVTIALLIESPERTLEHMDRIQVGMIKDGTALGDALFEGVKELKSNAASKNTIVLLSDGSNNAGHLDPLTAADFAKENNIVVYSVGLGKQGLVPFPVNDPTFGKRTVMAAANVDDETLREVARITGGTYFRAEEGTQLKDILRAINNALTS